MPAMTKMRQWTAEEDELVRTLHPDEAAKRIGVTANTIFRRRKRLGVGAHTLQYIRPEPAKRQGPSNRRSRSNLSG
jgi:hypothetical protein